MQISNHILNTILNNLVIKFKEFYNEYNINSYREETFEDFINTTIYEVEEKLSTELNIDEYYNKISRNVSQTKKRWVNKELTFNKNTCLYQEIAIEAPKNLKKFGIDKFSVLYNNITSIEDLKIERIKELKKWCNDDTYFLSNFPYIYDKKKSQIYTALRNDILLHIASYIKKECPTGKSDITVTVPNLLTEIPIDCGYKKIEYNNEVTSIQGKEKKYVYNDYFIDESTLFRTYADIEFLKEKALQKAFSRALNSTDIKIFAYIMTLRDENFFNSRTIVVDIGDIVRNVFESDGSRNYKTIKDSLFKLSELQIQTISENTLGFNYSIFDNVDIYLDINGKTEMATIIVNDYIVQQFTKHQTISMYKRKIDKFILDSSKIMVFPLQHERIRCHIKNNLTIVLNYDYFRGKLRLSNKRKKDNLKIITKTLQELVKNSTVIKDFKPKGYVFSITFYPITDSELHDLLSKEQLNVIIKNTEDKLIL